MRQSWWRALVAAAGLAAAAACGNELTEPLMPASGDLRVSPTRDTLFITDSTQESTTLTPQVAIFGNSERLEA